LAKFDPDLKEIAENRPSQTEPQFLEIENGARGRSDVRRLGAAAEGGDETDGEL
jgi:hypothetical protein